MASNGERNADRATEGKYRKLKKGSEKYPAGWMRMKERESDDEGSIDVEPLFFRVCRLRRGGVGNGVSARAERG